MGYTPPDSVIIRRIQRAFPSDELRERSQEFGTTDFVHETGG